MAKRLMILNMVLILLVAQSTMVYGKSFSYGNQLTQDEKTIYTSIYNHFCQKSNILDFTQNLNESSSNDLCNVLQSKYTLMAKHAFSAIANDYPEYYWAKTVVVTTSGLDYYTNDNFSYSQIQSLSIQIKGNTPHANTNIKKFNKQIKAAIKKINKYAGKNPSKAKIVKAINKWICKNTKYDKKHALLNNTKYEYIHNAYGVFVKKKAVCDGYAAAFKLLCEKYNIPCLMNLGYVNNKPNSSEKHAWNLVRIKKKWYIVDCTINDTVKVNKWLLAGSKTVKRTHISDIKRMDILGEGIFKSPIISKKNYK